MYAIRSYYASHNIRFNNSEARLVISHDVTERIRTRKELEVRERHLDVGLAQGLADLLDVLEPDGDLSYNFV